MSPVGSTPMRSRQILHNTALRFVGGHWLASQSRVSNRYERGLSCGFLGTPARLNIGQEIAREKNRGIGNMRKLYRIYERRMANGN